jgi:starvation-inducible DNA-binding protein
VQASLLAFEEISRIEDETGGPLNSQKMIQTLADDHEEMVKEGEALVSALEDVDDAATADLVVDTIKQHQKNAWMLKSSLEAHK